MKEHPTLKGYYATKDGRFYSNKSGGLKEIKQIKYSTGYYMLNCRIDGVGHQIGAHRFVAEIYLPNPDNLKTVNHKDCDKSNNKVSNLEWMSYHDNSIHGRTQMGKRYLIENVKNGEKYEIRNLVKWCEDIGINRTSAYHVMWGKQKTLKNRTYKITQMGW